MDERVKHPVSANPEVPVPPLESSIFNVKKKDAAEAQAKADPQHLNVQEVSDTGMESQHQHHPAICNLQSAVDKFPAGPLKAGPELRSEQYDNKLQGAAPTEKSQSEPCRPEVSANTIPPDERKLKVQPPVLVKETLPTAAANVQTSTSTPGLQPKEPAKAIQAVVPFTCKALQAGASQPVKPAVTPKLKTEALSNTTFTPTLQVAAVSINKLTAAVTAVPGLQPNAAAKKKELIAPAPKLQPLEPLIERSAAPASKLKTPSFAPRVDTVMPANAIQSTQAYELGPAPKLAQTKNLDYKTPVPKVKLNVLTGEQKESGAPSKQKELPQKANKEEPPVAALKMHLTTASSKEPGTLGPEPKLSTPANKLKPATAAKHLNQESPVYKSEPTAPAAASLRKLGLPIPDNKLVPSSCVNKLESFIGHTKKVIPASPESKLEPTLSANKIKPAPPENILVSSNNLASVMLNNDLEHSLPEHKLETASYSNRKELTDPDSKMHPASPANKMESTPSQATLKPMALTQILDTAASANKLEPMAPAKKHKNAAPAYQLKIAPTANQLNPIPTAHKFEPAAPANKLDPPGLTSKLNSAVSAPGGGVVEASNTLNLEVPTLGASANLDAINVADRPEQNGNSEIEMGRRNDREETTFYMNKTIKTNQPTNLPNSKTSEDCSQDQMNSSPGEQLANDMNEVLLGRCQFDKLPSLPKKVVRIFLSSTFTGNYSFVYCTCNI